MSHLIWDNFSWCQSLLQESFCCCLLLFGKQYEQYLLKLGQGLQRQGFAKVLTAWNLRGLTQLSALTNSSFVSRRSLTCWSIHTCSFLLHLSFSTQTTEFGSLKIPSLASSKALPPFLKLSRSPPREGSYHTVSPMGLEATLKRVRICNFHTEVSSLEQGVPLCPEWGLKRLCLTMSRGCTVKILGKESGILACAGSNFYMTDFIMILHVHHSKMGRNHSSGSHRKH